MSWLKLAFLVQVEMLITYKEEKWKLVLLFQSFISERLKAQSTSE